MKGRERERKEIHVVAERAGRGGSMTYTPSNSRLEEEKEDVHVCSSRKETHSSTSKGTVVDERKTNWNRITEIIQRTTFTTPWKRNRGGEGGIRTRPDTRED
jgi:hypothetical protein